MVAVVADGLHDDSCAMGCGQKPGLATVARPAVAGQVTEESACVLGMGGGIGLPRGPRRAAWQGQAEKYTQCGQTCTRRKETCPFWTWESCFGALLGRRRKHQQEEQLGKHATQFDVDTSNHSPSYESSRQSTSRDQAVFAQLRRAPDNTTKLAKYSFVLGG